MKKIKPPMNANTIDADFADFADFRTCEDAQHPSKKPFGWPTNWVKTA